MNDNQIIYPTCRTEYRQDTGTLHAPIFRIKTTEALSFRFTLKTSDQTHYAFREFMVITTGSSAKIYEVNPLNESAGISVMFIKGNGYYTLYVRGNYAGNAVTLQVHELNKANYVEFIHYGKYTKSTTIPAEEIEIKPAKPARNNGERIYLTNNNFQNGWNYLEGFYTVKNGICYVSFSAMNGTMTNGTVILSGLPSAQWHDSDPKHMYVGLAKSYADDTYYGCVLRLSGGGKVTIDSVKGNKSLIASFSYPTYDEKY